MNASLARRRKAARGFTLIEIMVVIVIIGLIVGIVGPQIINQLTRAEIGRARADMDGIAAALDLFRLEHFRYPTQEEGLEILLGEGEVDGRPTTELLQSFPRDPWGREYIYEFPSTHNEAYDLYTLGADGEEGGEGANADIGSWDLK
jgi:general secretion pathway protein G